MSMFQVGDLAITHNSVWLANNGLLVQVVAVNAQTQSGQTSPYAIRPVDEPAFAATLVTTSATPPVARFAESTSRHPRRRWIWPPGPPAFLPQV